MTLAPRERAMTPDRSARRAGTEVASGARRAAAIALLLALAGCDSVIHGNGVFGQETRSVGPFSGVSIGLGIIGTVRGGASATSVTISGDANVLQYIKTEVVSGVLTTRLSGIGAIQSDHPIQLVVATPQLSSAEAWGQSRVGCTAIPETGTFTAKAREGSGLTLAAGTGVAATLISVEAAGTSSIDASAYPAGDGTAALSGASRAIVQIAPGGTVTGTVDGSALTVKGGGACAVGSLPNGGTCTAVP